MLLLTIFSILTRFLGFVFKIYLTKIMTTTELGIYNLTLSVYMVLITLVGSSIPLTISKITSNNLNLQKSSETKYSITTSLIMTTLFSIFLSIMLIISKPLITLIVGDQLGYFILLSLIPSIIFTAIYSQIRGYLWGLENYYAVSMVEFVEQLLRIGFCILFALTDIIKSPVIAVSTSLSIACGISCFYGLILYFKNDGKFKYKKGYYKDIIKSTLPLTGVRLFGSLLQPLIAVLIPLQLCNLGMSKSLALSELGIIMGMTMPLLSIPSTIIGALCMVLIPRININNSKESLKLQINNYLKFTTTCIFIFIPIFISLSSQICNYVFGNIDAGIYMTYCCWIIIPLGLAQITTSILNALNQEQKTFIYYIISSILLIILIFILPKFVGVQAMLISMGFSSLLLAILNTIKIKKITGIKVQLIKSNLYHALLCIPVVILNNFCYNICIHYLGTLFSIIISCIISVTAFLSLLFIFGILEISQIYEYFLKIKKKNI